MITDISQYHLMRKNKRYELNFNALVYNPRTKLYDSNYGKNMTYAQASKNKWKCEKCLATFSAHKLLFFHKNEVHAY